MEKIVKKIKVIIAVLVIILLTAISFFGLYVKENGAWKNVVRDYKKGMELSAIRELRFVLDDTESEKNVYVDSEGNICGTVSDTSTASSTNVSLNTDETTTSEETSTVEQNLTEEEKIMNDRVNDYTVENKTVKVNPGDKINIDNFELAKKIIQKRLSKISPYEYNIRQDSITGDIILEVPDDDNTSLTRNYVETKGEIKIYDYQNGLELLSGDHIINTSIYNTTDEDGKYACYIQLTFDNEGKEALRQYSNQYKTIKKDDTTEKTYYITVSLDGTAMVTTYFGQELNSGVLNIPYGEAVETTEEFAKVTNEAEQIVNIIKNGSLPLTYKLSSNNYIDTSLTEKNVFVIRVVAMFAIVLVSAYLIVRFKLLGLIQAVYAVGYISIFSLVLKYTNVDITINSALSAVLAVVLNYVFVNRFLVERKNNTEISMFDTWKNTAKSYYLSIIPVMIIAFIVIFMSSLTVSSIGMVLFWGLVLQVLYSLIIIVM